MRRRRCGCRLFFSAIFSLTISGKTFQDLDLSRLFFGFVTEAGVDLALKTIKFTVCETERLGGGAGGSLTLSWDIKQLFA